MKQNSISIKKRQKVNDQHLVFVAIIFLFVIVFFLVFFPLMLLFILFSWLFQVFVANSTAIIICLFLLFVIVFLYLDVIDKVMYRYPGEHLVVLRYC